MMTLLIATSLFAGPSLPTVELCEYNQTFDRVPERLRYRQLIFWRWSSNQKRYVVAEYHLLKTDPVRVRDKVIAIKSDGSRIEVRAKAFKESLTSYDPEQHNLRVLPASQRRPYLTEVCE